jgi:hypothetical protein
MALLYVLCEGDDDERFFDRVVQPRLSYSDREVKYFQYAECPHEDVRNLLHSILDMRADGIDADYLFLRDYDRAPCKAFRFDEIDRAYDELVARDRTFLVVQMIESWYVAGLANQHALPMLDDAPSQTDDLLKRDVETMRAEDADRVDVLQEILKHFDIERARYKNDSFEYFCSSVLD